MKWRLFKALLVAAAFSDVTSKVGWTRLLAAFQVWFGILESGGKRVSPLEYERRMRVCHSCVLFHKPLLTCGSPLRKDSPELGCWCFMPTKAKFEESTCWLDDNLGEDAPHGWKTTKRD